MESICYIAVEDANICNVLQRWRVSNRSSVIQLIRDLNYGGYTYSKPFFSHIMYQTFTYLRSHNKLYEDISIAKGLLSKSMFRFSDIVETQMQTGCVFKQLFRMKNKLLKKNILRNRLCLSRGSIKHIHRSATTEPILVSEIPNIANDENIIITPGQGKNNFNFKWWICKVQAFLTVVFQVNLTLTLVVLVL